MKKLSFLFLTIGIIWGCWAESPKREFRATWLASVSNIDWPKSTQTSEEQKAALIKIFEGYAGGPYECGLVAGASYVGCLVQFGLRAMVEVFDGNTWGRSGI